MLNFHFGHLRSLNFEKMNVVIAYVRICLSVYSSVRQSVCPPICLSTYLPVSLFVYLSNCLSPYLSVSLSVSLFVYLSNCLSG
jgi:hypothetical protein